MIRRDFIQTQNKNLVPHSHSVLSPDMFKNIVNSSMKFVRDTYRDSI